MLAKFKYNYFSRPQIKEKMKTRFIDNPDYDFNKVNNASQACGPLVKWAKAQVNINTF